MVKKLRREVRPATTRVSRHVLLAGAASFAGAIAALGMVVLVESRYLSPDASAEPAPSQDQIDDLDLRVPMAVLTREAFPAWAQAHPDTVCPASLEELVPYADSAPTSDPWGTPYRYVCTPALHLRSAGPDRLFHTADDQWDGIPR